MSNPIRFKHIPDVAQYKGSDYSNAIRVERGITVETGEFGAMMDVELVNDGPVTIWLEREAPPPSP